MENETETTRVYRDSIGYAANLRKMQAPPKKASREDWVFACRMFRA